jgi:hypothetical protein
MFGIRMKLGRVRPVAGYMPVEFLAQRATASNGRRIARYDVRRRCAISAL